jgi:hypothetical protein
MVVSNETGLLPGVVLTAFYDRAAAEGLGICFFISEGVKG